MATIATVACTPSHAVWLSDGLAFSLRKRLTISPLNSKISEKRDEPRRERPVRMFDEATSNLCLSAGKFSGKSTKKAVGLGSLQSATQQDCCFHAGSCSEALAAFLLSNPAQ